MLEYRDDLDYLPRFRDSSPFVFLDEDDLSHLEAAYQFSPRQLEILRLIVLEKWSARDVADHLRISRRTVRTHLFRVREKILRKI